MLPLTMFGCQGGLKVVDDGMDCLCLGNHLLNPKHDLPGLVHQPPKPPFRHLLTLNLMLKPKHDPTWRRSLLIWLSLNPVIKPRT